ncbi:hypothetical protein AB5J72_47165 [Streptomyces sp. CG1]|uniref:hypothetical protein n=1 Tax=Streptomyces sp. CG1 TaxID=1287523 RepID=UPI0034E3035C
MLGASYVGMVRWLAAASGAPELKANRARGDIGGPVPGALALPGGAPSLDGALSWATRWVASTPA